MTEPRRSAVADPDPGLDAALSALPEHDLDPLRARALELDALRRLAQPGRRPSRWLRFEPAVLVALALLQLLWSAARVLALAG